MKSTLIRIMIMETKESLAKSLVDILHRINACFSGGAMDDQQRASNGQFGSGGGGGGGKSKGKKMARASFASEMTKKSFRPTAAQMQELSKNTMEVIGKGVLPTTAVGNINNSAGTGTVSANGKSYEATRSGSNGKWYITGEK